jgi:hypothetical protein
MKEDESEKDSDIKVGKKQPREEKRDKIPKL